MPRTNSPVLALSIASLVACGGGGTAAPIASAPIAVAPAPGPEGPLTAGPGVATVEEANAFVAEVDATLRKLWGASSRASWINQNFITTDTEKMSAAAREAVMEYLSRVIPKAQRFVGLPLAPDVARQIHMLRFAGALPAPSAPKLRAELATVSVEMQSYYGKAKYCGKSGKEKCRTLDELSDTLATSRKYDELLEAWVGWHSTAAPIKDKYARFVELGNQGAKEIGFSDLGDLWRSDYDMPPDAFEKETDRLWLQVKPLYDELHCYVRAKLRAQYGKDKVPDKAPIPAHLLGNMWAQEWNNLYSLVEPYKGQPSLDVTKSLVAKKYDEKKMIALGESFFVSLGFDKLPETFWTRSLMKRPADRDVVCHASAWDVADEGDLRIKMCVEIKEQDLITIHHELGHVFYYQQYHNLPILLQAGANDGFHEGIGDTLALSVTPGYLKGLGLLAKAPDNPKAEINFLLKKALEKISFLPFGKLIDQWRWDVFSGKTPKSKYQEAWWALRRKYQGVAPPVPRTEEEFDPGAKYHVPANTPYVRYFLAAIYQFQFHRALCKAAGHKGPLTTCSIYGSKEAGEKLRAMLAMGASKPWPEALKAISGESSADATAMLEYFEPLRAFLREQTKAEQCGW